MSAIQSKAPLTAEQAQNILVALSLLNTEVHKTSKLIFYDTKISLEPDSSIWRSVSSYIAPVKNNFNYYAGYSTEPESRDISKLCPLMEKVKLTFENQQSETPAQVTEREALAGKALAGLELLHKRYTADNEKELHLGTAVQLTKKIKETYEGRVQSNRWNGEWAVSNEKDREIQKLNQKIAVLESFVRGRDEQVESLKTQIAELEKNNLERQVAEKDQQIEKLTQELSRYKQALAREDINNVVINQNSSSETLYTRMYAILDILTTNQTLK